MHAPSPGNSHSRKHQSRINPQSALLNCMVIARDTKYSTLLREYIGKIPKLHFTTRIETIAELLQQLGIHKADILFVDVHMFDQRMLHRARESNPHLIVIGMGTAAEQEQHDQGADLFSYLAKPFSFERFFELVNRVKDFLATPAYQQPVKSKQFLFVKSEYKIIKVMFEDILFCEGMKDYTQVYLKGKTDPILTLNNLKLFLSKLPPEIFIRVHRSYIVSISHIDSITRNEIYVGKKIIPIGDSYKDDFYKLIDSNS